MMHFDPANPAMNDQELCDYTGHRVYYSPSDGQAHCTGCDLEIDIKSAFRYGHSVWSAVAEWNRINETTKCPRRWAKELEDTP